jgi:anaerobic selenocysteine-containing dehydrogenase
MRDTSEQRRSESTVETACPLDCPDSCSLRVSVRDGRIVKIDGSARRQVTEGYICAKVRRFADRVYGDARILHPAVRDGRKGTGTYREVDWDEALDTITTRIEEVRARLGGEAILPFSYGGSNGLVSQDTTDLRLFRRLGASRLARTACAAATGTAHAAMYGKMPGVTYADYRHARLIVIWGANPSVTGLHLVPHVREAQRAGATLVVIDPRRTPLARHADLHLAVRPGSDMAVALAVHKYLFEEELADQSFLAARARGADRLREKATPWTFERAADVSGVPAEALARFAQLYAQASPAVIRCGWGLERNRNGGSAVMAVLALPAVGGKFGVRGGGFSMSDSSAWNLNKTWIGAEEPDTRVVNMTRLGRALTELDDPPVGMLFVYNCNPVATMPDQNRVIKGLQREDLFTVVFEQVVTDTARYADVVLPATTFLEGYDIARAYGPASLQLVKPIVDAEGEARSNAEVFCDLATRLGLQEPGETSGDLDTLCSVVDALPERVRRELWENGVAAPDCGTAPVQLVDVHPRTADGRIDLFPEALDVAAPVGLYGYQPDPATGRHPLALISPASGRTINSTLGELPRPLTALSMHPDDARPRFLEDGDQIRVFNDLGEVRCGLSVTPVVRPGTVSLPKGLWRNATANGSTSTALVPDALTDIGGGACFNDARVEVERISH